MDVISSRTEDTTTSGHIHVFLALNYHFSEKDRSNYCSLLLFSSFIQFGPKLCLLKYLLGRFRELKSDLFFLPKLPNLKVICCSDMVYADFIPF